MGFEEPSSRRARVAVVCAPGYESGTGYRDRCNADLFRLRKIGYDAELVVLDTTRGLFRGIFDFWRKLVTGGFQCYLIEHYVVLPVAVVAIPLGLLKGRVLVVVHGVWQEGQMLSFGAARLWFTRLAEAFSMAFIKNKVFVSDTARRTLDQGARGSRSVVLPNVPDLKDSPNPDPHGGDTYALGYAGGIQPWQDLDLLFKTLLELQRLNDSDLRALLLTRDPDGMARLAERFGADRIVDIKCVPRESVPMWLAKCRMLWMVRRPNNVNSAACPTKALEYLLAGKSVVAHPQLGDVEEWNRLFGGLVLCPSTEPSVLAGLVQQPVRQTIDQGLLLDYVAERELEFSRLIALVLGGRDEIRAT